MDEVLNISFGALCAWRENRAGGRTGMQSVLNVLANRAKKRNTSIYDEAVRPGQFSSMTNRGDQQLTLYPLIDTPEWARFTLAVTLATSANDGTLLDITDGATMYYAPAALADGEWRDETIGGNPERFPAHWDISNLQYTHEIAGQLFFREIA